MQEKPQTVRLKVSPEVARIVTKGAPRDVQMAAARGALPLGGKDLLTCLLFFCGGQDVELRQQAVATLRELPEAILRPVLADVELHPQLLELVMKLHLANDDLMAAVIAHPNVQPATLLAIATKGGSKVLERLAAHQGRLAEHPELVAAIIANPQAERALKFRLGWQDPAAVEDAGEEEVDEERIEEIMAEAEKEGLSKYQLALDLKVSEKIKIALTGDKEWRNIMIKDSNKLVQAGVMKNPRITEGEVMMIAKNKTSSEDLIRQILFNKDWMKNYEIKRALVTHPKTPAPQALRLVPTLNTKDLKDLARSRNVSTMLKTTAFKDLERRLKRGG